MESIDFEDILNSDIDQDDETPYLLSDGMDAALDRQVERASEKLNDTANSQRNRVLAWLRKKPLTTLQARQELYIMSIAARIFELKAKGYEIATYPVNVTHGSKRKIAQYVLLAGGVADE